MYARKEPLLERLNRAKNNLIARESKKFSSKERKDLFIKTIDSFSSYTDQVLREYVDTVFNTSNDKIRFTAAWYKAYYVVLPEAGIWMPPKLNSRDAMVLDDLLREAQQRYYQDIVKKSGPIDPETPITSFYMSKEAYDFFDELRRDCTSDLQLQHIIACYQLYCVDNKYICIMPIGEIGMILEACGYNIDDIFKEMQLEKEINCRNIHH